MNAYRTEATLSAERKLTLPDLPFKPGTSLEVIILETPKPDETLPRYPLRGTAYRLDDPFAPVVTEEWEVLK